MSMQLLQGQWLEPRTVTDNTLPPPPIIIESDIEILRKKKYARAKLQTAHEIANEIARVYRSVKSGELDPNVGTKLTYILSTLAKIRTDGTLEDRIAALENRSY
jgi:hypothetical protein